MSLIAVFSDSHSNLEALEAVLADMQALKAERLVCLGDVVGYAANPVQCLEAVRELKCLVIKGNHDEAVAGDFALTGITGEARVGMEFSRRKLSSEQRDYLDGLPLSAEENGCQFVHASLDNPEAWHYVLREGDARSHFEAQTHPVCFCGHTHVPQLWNVSKSGAFQRWLGKGRMKLPASGKSLINVGSVGQSRDQCVDACYVLYDTKTGWLEFRRVPYDIAKTQGEIRRARLPSLTADRLALGE